MLVKRRRLALPHIFFDNENPQFLPILLCRRCTHPDTDDFLVRFQPYNITFRRYFKPVVAEHTDPFPYNIPLPLQI